MEDLTALALGNRQPPDQRTLLQKLAATWPAKMAQSIWGGLTLPGDVYAGRVEPGGLEAIGRAAELTGVLGSGAPATAVRGAAGIFGGRLAKTADLEALARAEAMEKAGAYSDDIWTQTGWGRGADKHWRFEIDDSAARLNPSVMFEKYGPVSDAFEHPALFAAYPKLAKDEAVIRSGDVPRGSYMGSRIDGVPGSSVIAASGRNDASLRSTMLHELQHGVQDIEGFARGGSNIELRPGTPAWEIYQERLRAIATPRPFEEFVRMAGYDDLKQAAKDYKEYLKMTKKPSPMVDRAAQEYATTEAYRRLAGETEARNVQGRQDWSASQRLDIPPGFSQDIPTAEQIVRFK
jgi:hypothetical protein